MRKLILAVMAIAAPAAAQIRPGGLAPAVTAVPGLGISFAGARLSPSPLAMPALSPALQPTAPPAFALRAAPVAPEATPLPLLSAIPPAAEPRMGAAPVSALDHVRLAAAAPQDAGAGFDGLAAKLSMRADRAELGALSVSVKFSQTIKSAETRALFARLGMTSLRYEQANGGYWLLSSADSIPEAARKARLLAAEEIVSEVAIGEAATRLLSPAASEKAPTWRLKLRESAVPAADLHDDSIVVRVKFNAARADVARAFSGLTVESLQDDSYRIVARDAAHALRAARSVARHPVTTAVVLPPELSARREEAPLQKKAVARLLVRMPDAVLLDWDDTLVDEKEIADAATLEVFRELGVPAPPLEEARRQWSTDHAAFYARFFPGISRKTVEDAWNSVTARIRRGESVGGRMFGRAALAPGALEVLRTLKGLGVPLAVVSNKNEEALREEIAASGLEGFFAHVYGNRDGRPLKPSPLPIVETLRALGVGPGNVWYIGDQLSDMEAARGEGLRRILIGRRSRALARGRGLEKDPAGDIVFIDDMRQLTSILNRLPAFAPAGRRN